MVRLCWMGPGGLALVALGALVACGTPNTGGVVGAPSPQAALTRDPAAGQAPSEPALPEQPTPEPQPIQTADDPLPSAEPAPAGEPDEAGAVVVTAAAPDPAGAAGAPLSPGADDGGVPMPVTTGQVSLSLGPLPTDPSGELTLTVANGLDGAIYTEDLKTGCTVVMLESWDGAAWQPVSDCGVERLPRTVMIAPGHGLAVVIRPFDPGGSPVRPGSYRARFSYRLAPGPAGEEPAAVASEPFELRP